MSNTIELKSVPSTLSFYLRALTARKSGRIPEEESELGRAVLKGRRVDARALRAYREVCGFPAADSLPATYPFVLAAPLHMELLVSDTFPLPVMGLVHLRNSISQLRPIGSREKLDIECTLSGPRPAARGLEFDLYTGVFAAGERVWECVTTMLRRDTTRRAGRRPEARRKTAGFEPDSVIDWSVPANTGRRYARVSGDSNPIHLSALTARLFGFRRAIAHGMWTKARCLAQLDSLLPRDAFRVSVEFKQPVFLPGGVQFQHRRGGDVIEFSVRDGAGRKPHLSGSVAPLWQPLDS
ncbi:MaoC family dehydratase [Microbulbifer litoralis]|uniref:MaoC family dehydratase n=1 Tax=Microbulbifer litoralis TaxID=2933965 RepID=UPI0020292AAE|nr:MaoC/PaaZ C-terminal domain-containing protein [Microbulbifer sp. GX H0434]